MEKCKTRKNFMNTQFRIKKLQHTRIQAHIPETLPKIIPSNLYPNLKKEEYACLCSHLKAMNTGTNQKEEYMIVMEDDTVIPFNIDYDKLIGTAPKDWQILQLFVSDLQVVNKLYKKYLEGTMWDKWKPGNFCTGIYIIKKQAAHKINSSIKQNNQIDLSKFKFSPLADNLLYRLVPTYSCTYPLFHSNISLNSEIHETHLHRHKLANDRIKQIQNKKEGRPNFI